MYIRHEWKVCISLLSLRFLKADEVFFVIHSFFLQIWFLFMPHHGTFQKYKQGPFSCEILAENNFIKHLAIKIRQMENMAIMKMSCDSWRTMQAADSKLILQFHRPMLVPGASVLPIIQNKRFSFVSGICNKLCRIISECMLNSNSNPANLAT